MFAAEGAWVSGSLNTRKRGVVRTLVEHERVMVETEQMSGVRRPLDFEEVAERRRLVHARIGVFVLEQGAVGGVALAEFSKAIHRRRERAEKISRCSRY